MMAVPTPRQHAFGVWWHELDRWVIPASLLMGKKSSEGWPTVRIADLVRQVTDRIEVMPDREYKMAGVRWYGEGVFHRETVPGDRMSARYVTSLIPGALIYNRLFAWKESFAVVPFSLADCYVSNEFPQFVVDGSRVLAEYLYLYCTTPHTIRAVNAASTGSAAVSRNRFREEFFLQFEVPLPPLEVQREVVATWEQAQREIAATYRQISELEAQIEADFLTALGLATSKRTTPPKVLGVYWADIERWSVMFNQLASQSIDLSKGSYPVTTLGQVAVVSYGIQKSPANRPAQHARPYLRVANVQRGMLDLREIKTINVSGREMAAYRLEPGDLLFVEGNGSRAELGRCAIWNGEIPDCVHQNHILKVRIDKSRLMPVFAMTWFNTDVGKDHFFRNVKTSSGLGTINSSELRAAPIPVPPISTQRRLVVKSEAQRRRVTTWRAAAEEKAEQARTKVESLIFGKRRLPKT